MKYTSFGRKIFYMTEMLFVSYLRYENFNHKKYLLGHSLAELVCNFVPDKKTKYYVYTITTHRNRAN